MKNISILLFIFFSFSCNQPGKTPSSDDAKRDSSIRSSEPTKSGHTANTQPERRSLDGCYIRVMGRDTLLLQLKQTGEKITGTMHFDNYEKDSSKGTVEGKLEDGKLVLWYSFTSEGMQSFSEQILKPSGNDLILGYGNIDVRHDSAFIKDKSAVTFSEKDKLVQTSCANK